MRYIEVEPVDELKEFISYFWVFEKLKEDSIFQFTSFFPGINSVLAIQVLGLVSIKGDNDIWQPSNSISALSGSKKSHEALFPGDHLVIGTVLKPGAPSILNLFSPRDISGLKPIDSEPFNKIINQCQNIYRKDKCLKPLIKTVESYFLNLARATRLEKGLNNCLDLKSVLPKFGSKLTHGDLDNKLSLRQIERLCLNYSGYTPREFMTISACGEARQRIFNENYCNLSDLALELGFYDQAHFTRSFKKWNAITPGKYNKRFSQFREHMEVLYTH